MDIDTSWAAATLTQYWQQRLAVTLRPGTARAVRRVLAANVAHHDGLLQAPDYDSLARVQ